MHVKYDLGCGSTYTIRKTEGKCYIYTHKCTLKLLDPLFWTILALKFFFLNPYNVRNILKSTDILLIKE